MSIDNSINTTARTPHPARPATNRLHPYVYGAMGVTVLWFALGVWGFRGESNADYLFAIVTGFILMAAGIPCILWRVAKKRDRDDTSHENEAARANKLGFRDWAATDFAIWQDRLKGASAAVEALLPLVVAAFALTVFGIAFHFAVHH